MKHIMLAMLAAIVVGCGSTMTLEEMEEAEKVAATSEERAELRERIDTFYVNWDKANLYFENRRACDYSQQHQFYCDNVQSYKHDISKLGPDALVRVWKREYQACACVTNEQAAYLLKDIRRQMGMF